MSAPYYSDDSVTLYLGDCLDVLKSLPDASVDSVVTDPPYGLEFMGKDWDAPWKAREGVGGHSAGFSTGAPAVPGVRGAVKALPSYTGSTNPTCRNCGGTRNGNDRASRRRCVCDKPEFPNTTLPRMIAFQQWCEAWSIECLRVLKPGGHMLAFGGSRTWHRLAVAVEDAGFEIRDSIAWLYASGFPKSLDVSKAIDKAAGATREVAGIDDRALRRNPNGLTGVLRLDGFTTVEELEAAAVRGEQTPYGRDAATTLRRFHERAATVGEITTPATPDAAKWQGWGTALKPAFEPIVVGRKPLIGTVAANVLAYGTGGLNIGACRVGDESTQRTQRGITKAWEGGAFAGEYATGSAAGRWPANVVLDGSQADALDVQAGVRTSGAFSGFRNGDKFRDTYGTFGGTKAESDGHEGSTGGASRFFPTFRYEAKAPTAERPRAGDIAHPTVKPLDLMAWLVRLVTPPGGTVLDPFAGSGTTAEACVIEGFKCIAIEREATYLPLIVQRLSKPIQVGLDFGEGVA